MNYYQHQCNTANLSLTEHGAYTILMDTYFNIKKPLPAELTSLYRLCKAINKSEQKAVQRIADKFFPISELDGLRRNTQADEAIAKDMRRINAARMNGMKGGRPRIQVEPKGIDA